MARSAQDALAVLRGLQLVVEAIVNEQTKVGKHLWTNSSVRELLEGNLKQSANFVQQAGQNPAQELKKLQQLLRETGERGAVVAEGLRLLVAAKLPLELKMSQTPFQNTANYSAAGAAGVGGTNAAAASTDAANLDISSITLKELEEILSKRSKDREVSLRLANTQSKQVEQEVAANADLVNEVPKVSITTTNPTMPTMATAAMAAAAMTTAATVSAATATVATATAATTAAAATLIKSAPNLTKDPFKTQPPVPPAATLRADTAYVENVLKFVAGAGTGEAATPNIPLPKLSSVAKQRKVPSSRLGRMASFGGLFAGLGLGTINELTKGALGLGGSKNVKEALFSPANAERIVDTLCKVRGAALKIGQILSIQDSNVVSPQLAKAFERVRQAADYMPDWQVERVMTTQLGADWRERLTTFDEKPFAAASIGQVHRATLKNGMEVAIKIQYPGVAESIESDIDNLVGMLKVWDVFPQGFFIDNVVKVAKRELTWEVDYTREAEYTEKFKEMIEGYPEYYVPTVIKELTTSSVLTTELVPGVPLDKCFELSSEHRHHIAASVLKLCLRELFEIQCMQTDPNWSNFLYDADSKRLMLIDFGSTRFYQKKFIKNYRNVIICAANNDRQGVLDISREMGFLTGYETKQMEEAHVDAVMILGEIFRYDGAFDFGQQNTTERIAHLVPTMVAHRLCPPPEEIYSIHRKLSGIFLLCARLKVKLNCVPFYKEIVLDKFKE